jgi:hypothetical protein
MPEPMQARFYFAERDYVRAVALHWRLPWRFWIAVALLLLTLAFLWPHMIVMMRTNVVMPMAVGAVAGFCIIVLAIRLFASPLILRRNYRQYKKIQQEQTVTLLDDGVRFATDSGSTLLTWGDILKWRYNADYVLIYPMPRIFHIVPATVAAEGFDIERLKAALTQHVGAAKKP